MRLCLAEKCIKRGQTGIKCLRNRFSQLFCQTLAGGQLNLAKKYDSAQKLLGVTSRAKFNGGISQFFPPRKKQGIPREMTI